jgi:hypothetical protein
VFGPTSAICTGVQATSILELLTASTAPTPSVATVKVSGQSPQSFIQALFAASDTSLDPLSSSDDGAIAGRQQNSSSAAQVSPSVLGRRIAQQSIVKPQQAASDTSARTSIELPKGSAVAFMSSAKTAPIQQKREASTTKTTTIDSKTSRATVLSPDKSSLQVSMIVTNPLMDSTTTPQEATFLPAQSGSETVPDAILERVISVVSHPSSSAFSNAAGYQVANAFPGVTPNDTHSTTTTAAGLEPYATANETTDSSPRAGLTVDLRFQSIASRNLAPTVIPNSLPAVTQGIPSSSEASQRAIAVSNAVKSNTTPLSTQDAVTVSAPDVTQTTIPNSLANAGKTASESSILQVVPVLVQPATPKTQPTATSVSPTSTAENSQPAVLSSPQHPDTAPKQDLAHTSSMDGADQTTPLQATATPSGFATDVRAFNATTAQMAALVQPGFVQDAPARAVPDATTVTTSTDVTGAKAKESATGTFSDLLGLKQHAQGASDQAGSQGASQEPSSSNGQPQSGDLQPQQSSATTPMSFANHATALDHPTSAVNSVPTQPAGTFAGTTNPAKTHESPAPLAADPQQLLPAVNTAKLIQSMGQTEMRVGVRSNEFGNISINTSATRDLISAQISLDHSELAKTLVSHLPEIQARLGGTQAADVRIGMNGQATGQNAGSPGDPSPNGGGHSNGDRQQGANPGTGNPTGGFAEPGRAVSVAAISAPELLLDSRLDITA